MPRHPTDVEMAQALQSKTAAVMGSIMSILPILMSLFVTPAAHSQALGLNSQISGLKLNHWYSLTHVSTLPFSRRINGESSFNVPKNLQQLSIKGGTQITVLRYSKDGLFTLLGIDDDLSRDNPGIRKFDPVIVWVKKSDIVANMELKDVDIQALDALASMGIETDKPKMTEAKPIDIGSVDPDAGPTMTLCLRDVHISAVRLSRHSVPKVQMASKAFPKYVAAGWLPVVFSAKDPLGTVCFFSGGRRCGKKDHCGHAAIKIRRRTWQGAGMFPSPFLRSHHYGGRVPYHLQGCAVPPSMAAIAKLIPVPQPVDDLPQRMDLKFDPQFLRSHKLIQFQSIGPI